LKKSTNCSKKILASRVSLPMNEKTSLWLEQDRRHCWHPFTDQRAWSEPGFEPLVLVRGSGVWLWDSEGRRYFDGNSSIWTNIHGHAHSSINAALRRQLEDVAHTSYLGFANPRASELAERLCAFFPKETLSRVFFSDDGSTAVECAVKMALQYRMQSGEPERTRLVAFADAYHGDTMGAASLGGVSLFFERFRKFGMPVTFVRNIAELQSLDAHEIAAVIVEPLVQGVNQMHCWPKGMLRELRQWCDGKGVHLILDEVMTGFGRTGTMFACQQEQVVPDFLCLAKGLTGGYMPLAATLTSDVIYRAFEGPGNIFYYGHSYTANPLGCAAALASLEVFVEERVMEQLPEKIAVFSDRLHQAFPQHQLRVCGLIAGIELRTQYGTAFDATERMGARVCLAARKHGLLTRPIRDTVVLMPPLCSCIDELHYAVDALKAAVDECTAGTC
jgi:adenosylmethionine-8-amino-7-oxononanoate aminotransferase